MFSRRFDGLFDSDPFFEGHRQHMQEMEKIFRNPFDIFSEPRLGIEAPPDRKRDRPHRDRMQGGQELVPQSMFDFGGFDSMFSNMRQVMDNMEKNFEKASRDPDGHMFSHSSFASYSKMGGAEPKVYQASTSTTKAPGGVRETRKALRDSETGQEKMAIGRYLGDKGHVVQRQRNRRSGQEEENQEYVNMAEDEASNFDREWKDHTRSYREMHVDRGRRGLDRDHHRPRALPVAGGRHSDRARGRD